MLALLIQPAIIMANRLQTFHKSGVEGYSTKAWENSQIKNFIFHHTKENNMIVSNEPFAIYYFSQKETIMIPDFAKHNSEGKGVYLVLFYDCPWDFSKEIKTLKTNYHFKKIKNFKTVKYIFLIKNL